MQQEKQVTPIGLVYLGIVYVVWGSTYLAIRVAVREGAGFPPFTIGLWRVVIAGCILLLWGQISGFRIKPRRNEVWVLLISGLLMWPTANGLVNWASQRADSGLAAILLGSLPIWMALLEAIVYRKRPSLALIGSLLIGFVGIGVLSGPTLLGGVQADVWAILGLLGAPIAWSAGSLVQTHFPVDLNPRVAAGYLMLFGAIGFALMAIILKEPMPTPTVEAWWAFAYLTIIGGVVAFTAYVSGLQILPSNILMTYSYVNPVIALLLGWLILGEEITRWTVGGAALILLAVAGVFRERYTVKK